MPDLVHRKGEVSEVPIRMPLGQVGTRSMSCSCPCVSNEYLHAAEPQVRTRRIQWRWRDSNGRSISLERCTSRARKVMLAAMSFRRRGTRWYSLTRTGTRCLRGSGVRAVSRTVCSVLDEVSHACRRPASQVKDWLAPVGVVWTSFSDFTTSRPVPMVAASSSTE